MMSKKQFINQVGKVSRELNHLLATYQNHTITGMEYDSRVENMLKSSLFTNDDLMYYLRESDQ